MTDYPAEPPREISKPVMLQRWDSLSLIHWRYDPAVVKALLPPGLEPDTYDGAAWVGLVPFRMKHVRPRWIPAVVPWVGTFPETNIRTYVRGPDGTPGVYFSSLDITRLAGVAVARLWFKLPYNWARMRIKQAWSVVEYRSRRRWPGPRRAGCDAMLRIGEEIAPEDVTSLEHFLTARWGLFTEVRGALAYAPVSHARWPLHRAGLMELSENLTDAAGLPRPEGEPLVHYSPGVDVRIGRLEML